MRLTAERFLSGLDERPVAARSDAAGVREALGGALADGESDVDRSAAAIAAAVT